MTCGTDCPTCGGNVPPSPPRWTEETLKAARQEAHDKYLKAQGENNKAQRLANIRREDPEAAATLAASGFGQNAPSNSEVSRLRDDWHCLERVAKAGEFVEWKDGATRGGEAVADDEGRRYCSRACLTMTHDSDAGIITCEAELNPFYGEGGGADTTFPEALRALGRYCQRRHLVIDGLDCGNPDDVREEYGAGNDDAFIIRASVRSIIGEGV